MLMQDYSDKKMGANYFLCDEQEGGGLIGGYYFEPSAVGNQVVITINSVANSFIMTKPDGSRLGYVRYFLQYEPGDCFYPKYYMSAAIGTMNAYERTHGDSGRFLLWQIRTDSSGDNYLENIW